MDQLDNRCTDSSMEEDEPKLIIDEGLSDSDRNLNPDRDIPTLGSQSIDLAQPTTKSPESSQVTEEQVASEPTGTEDEMKDDSVVRTLTDQEDLTGTEDQDEDEGVEDTDDLGEDGEGGSASVKARAKHAITGRGVTLAMLMADGIIQPGKDTMAIEYLGQKFTGDLLADGKIRWKEEDKVFSSPSAWAIHCKKIVNPMKKSGCGWASVRYRGKKLDAYKSSWFRKQRMARSQNGTCPSKDEDSEIDENLPNTIKMEASEEGEEELPMTGTNTVQQRKASVKHSTLGKRSPNHNPNTLVDCIPFSALGKMQPFTLSLASNCQLLIDFHCHLTTSEVVGYLAGKWDPTTQHLTIQQSFPCKCRLGDGDTAPLVEAEIQQKIEQRGMSMVGWYHSHPRNQPDPSLRDIEAQMEYQLQLKGPDHSYHPCLGLIVSPYDSMTARGKESAYRVFHVLPPPEHRPLEYGMPMTLNYNISHDMFLSQDVLNEMKALVEFYKGEPDMINFMDTWISTASYLDKLKGSLAKKFPRDQTDGRFVEYIHNLLIST